MAEPTVTLSLRVSVPTRELVEHQAEKEGSTITDLVVKAIHRYVENSSPRPIAE